MRETEKWPIPSRLKKRNGSIKQIYFDLGIAVFFFVVGVVIDANKLFSDPLKTIDFSYIYRPIALSIFAFIATQLFPLRSVSAESKERILDISDKMDRLRQVHAEYVSFSSKMVKLSAMQDNPAHEALNRTLLSYLDSVEITDESLFVQGEGLSRELYSRFWDNLLQVQKKIKNGDRISVFTTHSTLVSLWESEEFIPLVHKQKEFIREGGRIFRILIDQDESTHNDECYKRVLRNMRSAGVEAFYLKVPVDVSEKYQDFLLVCLDHGEFIINWYTDSIDSKKVGLISCCKIIISSDTFRNSYWPVWCRYIDRLEQEIIDEEFGGNPTESQLYAMRLPPN